jgi:hypothetical protein
MWFTKRRIWLVVILLALIAVGYFVRLSLSQDIVPPEFREAREQGSVISQDIVNISNNISKDLERINQLDQEKKYEEALNINLNLIQDTIPELRSKATDLSKQLEKMAGALPKIDSEPARQDAIQSITNRMALISRLFSYSIYLGDLTNILRDHFREVPNAHSLSAVIAQINAEVTAINSFNRAASEAMNRFDRDLGKP